MICIKVQTFEVLEMMRWTLVLFLCSVVEPKSSIFAGFTQAFRKADAGICPTLGCKGEVPVPGSTTRMAFCERCPDKMKDVSNRLPRLAKNEVILFKAEVKMRGPSFMPSGINAKISDLYKTMVTRCLWKSGFAPTGQITLPTTGNPTSEQLDAVVHLNHHLVVRGNMFALPMTQPSVQIESGSAYLFWDGAQRLNPRKNAPNPISFAITEPVRGKPPMATYMSQRFTKQWRGKLPNV